jgi:hypothetical protein
MRVISFQRSCGVRFAYGLFGFRVAGWAGFHVTGPANFGSSLRPRGTARPQTNSMAVESVFGFAVTLGWRYFGGFSFPPT